MSTAGGDAVVRELVALLGEGAVVTEPHELARYEKGWRYGSGTALAAVRPGSTEEVARFLAFASERSLRVVPQGANTGLVGASTPDASGDMLVLSLERLGALLQRIPSRGFDHHRAGLGGGLGGRLGRRRGDGNRLGRGV